MTTNLKTAQNLQPDLLLLGHCELVANETPEAYRAAFPNSKIAMWWVGPLGRLNGQTSFNLDWLVSSEESKQTMINEKIATVLSKTSLYILLLVGPIIGFMIKGLAVLLLFSGLVALVGLVMHPDKSKFLDWRDGRLLIPFIIFIGLTCIWTQAPEAGESFIIVIATLIFTFSLHFAFFTLPVDWRAKYRDLLSASFLFGIFASCCIASYPIFFPELPSIMKSLSDQTTLGNIEILRQGNRSLSVVPIFLFLLGGFYWHKSPLFFFCLFVLTLLVSAFSESQTALLAVLCGGAAFALAHVFKKNGKKILFFALALGLLIAPFMFVQSFENRWVRQYAPAIVHQKASGEYREWIYYVYAKEALKRPLFGHGFEASHNYAPQTLQAYIDLASQRHIRRAASVSQKNGYVAKHAHNLALQIIFEFGYIGAVLFLLSLWWLINLRYSEMAVPFRSAALVSVFAFLSFSYSLWQSWLIAGLGIMFLYACILYRNVENGVDAEQDNG